MKQTLTAKIHLFPDDDTCKAIDQLMDTYRRACNYVSWYIYEHEETDYNTLHKALYQDIRERYELKSYLVQEAIKTTKAAYLSMKSNEHPWTRAEFKKPQCAYPAKNYRIDQEKQIIFISTLEKRIGIKYTAAGFEQYLSGRYKLGTAKIIKKKKEYYFYIAVTRQIDQIEKEQLTNAVGVDVGIRNIAVCHNSFNETMIFSGQEVIERRNHFVDLRSQLQEKRTKSANRRLKKIQRREHNWMEDINHCVSKRIVDSQPKDSIIVLEDLNRMNDKTKCFHKKDRYACHSWAYHSLQQKIIYKAAKNGQKVVKVPPYYTSSTCPKCGIQKKTNRNYVSHIYKCSYCGFSADDDVTAAMTLQIIGQNMIKKDC